MSDDFRFLYGSWAVTHKRLKHRLANSSEWEMFEGSCVAQPLMEGQVNVDDNVLRAPSGTYRAVSLRIFEPATGHWSIRWIDGRNPESIQQAVVGIFHAGVGTFYGEDTLNGKAVSVRFIWSDIRANSATWEQAFSIDEGKNWETNWIMTFHRLTV